MSNDMEARVEAQIRSALERGDFDNLPGAGKPIPGRGLPYDESWWITSFLEREALPTDLLLPTPLQLRRKIENLPDEVRDLPTEQAVRAVVADLNAQIVAWLRYPDGPRVAVGPVDVENVVRQWRTQRQPAVASPAALTTSPPDPAAPARRPWSWRVLWRRR
ncbi:DUF1992 domain-containing protein [Micromonospora sp. KC213]|uniref:DnaJ family domain-containing protein n=1 Tax=Micromonospora sp. KC213 TaxID=2530378 RepID=UPI0010503BE9|nr:DUF1992 domain-containing protein [Micromonospora sp. KC213]TDC29781.1 DUF1992 domain-containing protein [Micromonospora sp. KC213]